MDDAPINSKKNVNRKIMKKEVFVFFVEAKIRKLTF